MCLHRPLHTSATDQELPQTTLSNSEIAQKGLRTTVSPLMEVESDFGPSQTSAASNNATQVIVQVSFPPNLVPREKYPGFKQDMGF